MPKCHIVDAIGDKKIVFYFRKGAKIWELNKFLKEYFLSTHGERGDGGAMPNISATVSFGPSSSLGLFHDKKNIVIKSFMKDKIKPNGLYYPIPGCFR